MPMGKGTSKTEPGARNNWRTPDEVFRYLDRRYGPFTLDAAAEEHNAKCDLWLGPGSPIAEDALMVRWDAYAPHNWRRVFVNPPYDHTPDWISYAKGMVNLGVVGSVTLVVPATTDVKWWHYFVYDRHKCRNRPGVLTEFSKGRIRFLRPDGTPAGSPTHGTAFVTFYREGQTFPEVEV
jgi:phage N-6-adenine-methyltransferase